MNAQDDSQARAIIAWAAVAWTQFLIAITVIDKRDMHLIRQFVDMMTPESPSKFVFDSHPFGSAALLLNVISLALFSLPLSALYTWTDIGFDQQRYMRRAKYIGLFAHIIWGLSFLALLCYLNVAFTGVAFASFVIGGLMIGPSWRYLKKA